MAERPIIFSSAMVRAILEGRKTQTRRMLKDHGLLARYEPTGEVVDYYGTGKTCGARLKDTTYVIPCGYVPGDVLWVRETWCDPIGERELVYRADQRPVDDAEELRMRRAGIKSDAPWRSPIHMPREFSRITLRVTDVRVQRLQDISEEDAVAEGIRLMRDGGGTWVGREGPGPMVTPWPTAREAFSDLWDTINAKRGHPWESNPWVVAISFERANNG